MTYKVCIIVPVYNVAKHIELCARSLFEQTFTEIQYVFVNDCSLDDSVEILEKIIDEYPQRKNDIKILVHERNKGLACARKTGLQQVDADFILNVDSDDFVEPDMVELMYNKAVEEDADIVVCDFILEWGLTTKVAPQKYSPDKTAYTNLLLSGRVLPGVVNKLIRSGLYADNNIFPVEGINVGEDYSITPRLAYYANKIAKVDQALYHYIQTNSNSYTKSFSEKSAENIISAVCVLNDFFVSLPDYELYRDSLDEGKLRKKISLLMESKPVMRRKYATIFADTNEKAKGLQLTKEERITMFLVSHGLFPMLNIFLFFYWNLLELIQIVKGRRK